MAIVTRTGKGSRLTTTEMDNNFTELNTNKAPLVGGLVPTSNLPGIDFPSTDFDVTTPSGLQTVNIKESRIQDIAGLLIASLVDSSPVLLNTLNELAGAIGDDPNFSATMATALGLKAPLASPTFTGTVSGLNKSMVGLGNVDNTADSAKPISTAQATVNTTVTTAITAINTRLQTETQTYLATIATAGGTIDAPALQALDKFIWTGKRDGWYTLLNYIAPFVGNSLTTSLIPLKTPIGNITQTSFVAADFNESYGLKADTTGKYLSTGFVPSANGLSVTNFTMAAVRIQQDRSNTQILVSSLPATATEGSPILDFSWIGVARNNQAISAPDGMRHLVVTGRASDWQGFSDGVKTSANSSAMSSNGNTLQNEITVFRGKLPDGNAYNSTGTIGFLAFGTSLTDAQAVSLNKAMLEFTHSVRRVAVKKGVRFSINGDSNGAGLQGAPTWGNLLSTNLGWFELNHSLSGSYMNSTSGGNNSGVNKATEILDIYPEMEFVAMGTNDALNDGVTNGNSGTANSVGSNINTLATNAKAKGIKPIIIGIPWSSSINATKGAMYNAAIASACKATKTVFVNTYHLFADQTTPSSFFSDGIHFNSTGYEMVYNEIRYALQGKYFRRPTLDFGSIAAQTSADLTVTVYNAEVGMEVSVTAPISYNSGLVVSGFVSAADTVTVRVTNVTASGIDPASSQFLVSVLITY